MARMHEFFLDLTGRSGKARAVFFTALFFLLVFDLFFVQRVWQKSMDEATGEAVRIAMIAESGFSIDHIKHLNADVADLDKTGYQEIKNSLLKIASYHQDIHFAYIYTLRNDKVYFIADSVAPDSDDYSPPGQEYTEASESDKRPFYDGKIVVTEPQHDRWGNWVSILIPMIDPGTGTVIAVFGFDYTVNMWYAEAVKNTTLASALAVSILVIYLFLFAVLQKNIAIKNEKKKLSEINEKLSEQEALFRTVYEQSPIGIVISGPDGVTDVNPKYERIVGRSRDEILTLNWTDYMHPDDVEKDFLMKSRFFAGEVESYSVDKRYIRPDGSAVWARITLAPLKLGDDSSIRYLCLVEDISKRIRTEMELLESERSRSVLLSNLPGMAYRCKFDRDWTMEIVSYGCYELTGYKPESLINNRDVSFNDLIHPRYQEEVWNQWNQRLKEKRKVKVEYEMITAGGTTKWVFEQGQGIYDEDGNVVALEGLIIDITDQKKKEEEILYLNYHDYLTGIYNRRYIETEEARLAARLPLSVIMGDINGVKLVNDAFGHAEGDILIRETAGILKSCCREGDVLARTGGDEFMILMPDTDAQTAGSVMDSIKNACEEYNRKNGSEAYSLNISLGFGTKESEEKDLQSVKKAAEDHMYKRKLLEHKSSHSVILSSIKATMFEKSYETQEHAERIAGLSKKVGECLALPQEEMDELVLLATLHDIGKVGIDDRILNKEGALSEEEWIEMRKHSEIGYRIALSSPDFSPVAECILSLHERWDGNGYPQGIKGDEIPLLSRIVSVVDAYDAMTSDRPYRKAMTREAAVEELRKNAATQFDPEITELFTEKVLEKR